MPLFGRGNSTPATEANTPPAETPPTQPAPLDVNALGTTIAQSIIQGLTPVLQSQQQPQQRTADPEPEQDDDPEGTARIEKVAARVASRMSAPYTNLFEATLPEYARDNATKNLTEGQKLIYERHRDKVDQYVREACRANPMAASSPVVHQRAINLVLGEHAGEIEQVVIERLTPKDLPATFPYPTQVNGTPAQPQLTALQQNQMQYYQQANPRGHWTEEDLTYYSSIQPGTWAEMVAQHKANLEKK